MPAAVAPFTSRSRHCLATVSAAAICGPYPLAGERPVPGLPPLAACSRSGLAELPLFARSFPVTTRSQRNSPVSIESLGLQQHELVRRLP
jgi:hypothetical protein